MNKATNRFCLGLALTLAALAVAGCSPKVLVKEQRDPGQAWTVKMVKAAFSGRRAHSSVLFAGKMWVIGGYDPTARNDVWSSEDGAAWTLVTPAAEFSPRFNHTSLVYDRRMWVIGGFDGSANKNDVWSSADGAHWTLATANAAFSPRRLHASVVFDNRLWVISGASSLPEPGNKNDAWYSSDGATWSPAAAAAPFAPRYGAAGLAFGNKMWIIGGSNGYGVNFSDVWCSPDGAHWVQTAVAPFAGRCALAGLAYRNQMWVLGGGSFDYSGKATPYGDAWASTDGVIWSQVDASTLFSPRLGHSALATEGQMWVIGGWDGKLDGRNKADVCYSE